jgi:transposase-like protein
VFDLANCTLIDVLQLTPEECREILIENRWPDGVICPKCGAPDAYRITRRSQTKNLVSTLFKCRDCRRQFSATVGTIFEDSKIPLNKWFAAIYLMCSSKKGISAHQLHRNLDISYESAWFMCHRVREAMNSGTLEKLSGIVEVDETYVGSRSRRGHPTWHEKVKDEEEMGLREPRKNRAPFDDKTPVFGLIERDGGRAISRVVPNTKAETLRSIILELLDTENSTLMSDGHPAYRSMRDHLPHEVIDHEVEYVRRDRKTGILVHTQNIESLWSLLKRGIIGVFHHISVRRFQMYLHEFDFRASCRQVTDGRRFQLLLEQLSGRLLWFCRTPQPLNPYA